MPQSARKFTPPYRTPRAKRNSKESGRHWYYTARWKQLRKLHLSAHPFCVACQHEGKSLRDCIPSPAVVDHIEPHLGREDMFFRLSNLQTLCHRHHGSKTAAEDGGYGN